MVRYVPTRVARTFSLGEAWIQKGRRSVHHRRNVVSIKARFIANMYLQYSAGPKARSIRQKCHRRSVPSSYLTVYIYGGVAVSGEGRRTVS